jgi:hypothetical protein
MANILNAQLVPNVLTAAPNDYFASVINNGSINPVRTDRDHPIHHRRQTVERTAFHHLSHTGIHRVGGRAFTRIRVGCAPAYGQGVHPRAGGMRTRTQVVCE